jgi:hypothetical protein
LCRDDKDALDLIDQAVKRKKGPGSKKIDNVNLLDPTPDGNSEQAAIRRLRKPRPDLLGKLSYPEARDLVLRDGKGRPKKGEGNPDNIRFSYGTQAKYLRALLARDFPEIKARLRCRHEPKRRGGAGEIARRQDDQ